MAEKVLMKGNEAIAEAAIRAGCRHYFGYPITPQTEVAAYMAKRMPKIGGTFLQAESEISAINMVYGVAGTGKRVMTSSSSPGISLKQEGISYIAGADLPALIVNVQRGGPGLGGIQPSQSDYFQSTKGGGHGDYRMIVLTPESVQEMADMTALAFELAEKYRMPAMLLADGTMGQMMEPVELPEESNDTVEKPWAVTGTEGKREHNIINSLYLKPEELEQKNIERYERYKLIEETEARYESFMMDDAEYCVVAFGIAARVAKNAVVAARKEGVKVGMIRPITVWPFPKAPIAEAADKVRAFISVELSMGQMIEDIRLASECKKPVYLCNRVGGMIPSPEEVYAKIMEVKGGSK
ncbi:MAG: 3-methyl-2-oxobutanoate dehydrogenase subunit VorB [Oscillospiraceae bacterium]|nr:3-methyl-2-oxobutanoate dehydrogenase subunit VorB [Oscillospiraceae bacterium]MBQ4545238.1 3-methyl-2-oxobutanoate dehydrogenase subunit VorB [Oscillospiraceae bacterium]MBQ6901720.1 3-methyl-2-oxobutanoate dehydrogenase subunit VorB [Oscillospiraceae bacterium]